MRDMDKRHEFDTLKSVLVQLVQARGGDVSEVERTFQWPEKAGGAPAQAVAMAPFLTGGANE
jgi:hypothetical protein